MDKRYVEETIVLAADPELEHFLLRAEEEMQATLGRMRLTGCQLDFLERVHRNSARLDRLALGL